MAATSAPRSSSPVMESISQDEVEQLAPEQRLLQQAEASTSASADTPQTPTMAYSLSGPPHHQHSRSQPYVSAADIYAATHGAAGRRLPVSTKSLAHSATSSREVLSAQDELRAMSNNPYAYGAGTPTSISINTKRASVLSFQTALSGSLAGFLSADDSASGSARSSPAHRTQPLPSTTMDFPKSNSADPAHLSSHYPDVANGEQNKDINSTSSDRELLMSYDTDGDANALPKSDTVTTFRNLPSTHSGITNAAQTEDSLQLQGAIPDFPPPVSRHDSSANAAYASGSGDDGSGRDFDVNGTVRRPGAHGSHPSIAGYVNALTPQTDSPGTFDEGQQQSLAAAFNTPVSDFRARPLANIESPSGQAVRHPSMPVAAALLPKGQFADADSNQPQKYAESPDSTPREPSPPPDGEVEARAEWERAQMMRSRMVSPTMGFSPIGTSSNTMTSRDRDSLRDSFRESLMMNGTATGSSPSSTTSPRTSRGKVGLRPLHLVNAAAAGTSAVDALNKTPGGTTRATSPPPSGPANENGAGRRSSGVWAGPGSPPFNGMRIPGNRSSANSSPALYYIDSTGATVSAGTPADANAFRARQRTSLQMQSPVLQSSAATYASPPGTGVGVSPTAPGAGQMSPLPASPGPLQQLQAFAANQQTGEGSSGPATPLHLGTAFGSSTAPTTVGGGASTHATAQQHATLTPEQIRAMAAEQLASMPVAPVGALNASAPGDKAGQSSAAAADEQFEAAPGVVPSQAPGQPGAPRSRAATLEAAQSRSRAATDATLAVQPSPTDKAGAPVAGAEPNADGTAAAPSSYANVTTQQLQRQQQREQRKSASGALALGMEGTAPGANGGPYPTFPSSAQPGPRSVASGIGPIPDKLAASSAALRAALEQVQFLQQQAVSGVGTRPPAEIAAIAAEAQALANNQAVLNAARAGVPRESKTYPGIQPQHSLVPPFELQHRPDGLPSAMIGPNGVRKSLNDPEVCLECMMRDEDMIDVHVNATSFWERESDAQFEEGCRLERDDEDRRKSLALAASVKESEVDGEESLVDGEAPGGEGSHRGDSASSNGQSGSTKVDSLLPAAGFGITHVVGQTGISISPRDAMGLVRIGGSRMRVKKIAKGDPLTAERLKLHTQMNPPASSHRWRALQNFLATQAKYIAMEQRARYEAAAAAEREAVASGQVANVQYDNKIIRGATMQDIKARQANGIYMEDVLLDPNEQEQKARDIVKAQDLRKRTSQRASVAYDPDLAPRLNQQLPPVPPESDPAPPKAEPIRRGSVPGLVEPSQNIGDETPNLPGAPATQFNTPLKAGLSPNPALRLGAVAAYPQSNGDDRLSHAALSPGSPLGPSTPGVGAHGQSLGSPMSVGRSAYGFPDANGTKNDATPALSPIAKSEASMGRDRSSSVGADESLGKGRGKGLKKLFSKVAGGAVDAESLRSGSLDRQTPVEAEEMPERNRASQISNGKGRESGDGPVAPRFASIVSDGQKRSASALGILNNSEPQRSPDPDAVEKPTLEVNSPPGGYYNDPALAVSQTSLDIGPFQNPVPPPRLDSKALLNQRKKTLPDKPDGSADVDDAIVAELASRPGRPARDSAAGATMVRTSSENGSPIVNITSTPKMNGNGTGSFSSRMSAQSIGSGTIETARKSVSSVRNSPSTTTPANHQFASTTPSMASLREVTDDSGSISRAQFGSTPVPERSRSRNRSGSNSRISDFLKPSEQRSTPRKRSFFFRRSKMPSIDQDEDLAPRTMPARPMTSMGLHGEGSGLGRAREEKAASRFQRLLGGLFGTSSRKKRTSMASGRSGSDFDPFNRGGASSRASGFLKSGGLSLPRILRSRASNSNLDKPLSLEKGISNNDPIPSMRDFSSARDERGLPPRAQSAMGRLPSQKFATSGPSFGRPTWATPRSFDEDDAEPEDIEMRRDPLASKRKGLGLGGSRNKLSTGQDMLKSPNQFGGSSSSIATSFTQYGGGPPPRLPVRQSSRGSNMKASINLSLPGVHEV
ncbi:hypothetical protein CF319_g5761 [Tilletia indica]|nr:hypothetical protein CF319_g5761 [Tilletia indica]